MAKSGSSHEQLIGQVVYQEDVTIEYSMVRRYIDAVNNQLPLYSIPGHAKKFGLEDIPLPHSAVGSLGRVESVTKILELKPKQVLHSKESVTVYQPICVGQRVKVSTRIENIEQQRVGGNPMGFVQARFIITGARNVVLAEAERTFAVRGGFRSR